MEKLAWAPGEGEAHPNVRHKKRAAPAARRADKYDFIGFSFPDPADARAGADRRPGGPRWPSGPGWPPGSRSDSQLFEFTIVIQSPPPSPERFSTIPFRPRHGHAGPPSPFRPRHDPGRRGASVFLFPLPFMNESRGGHASPPPRAKRVSSHRGVRPRKGEACVPLLPPKGAQYKASAPRGRSGQNGR